MAYFVIHPDGARYGPAELPELQQWANEGRILPGTQIEEVGTGRTLAARDVPGLQWAGSAPPPMGQAYHRQGAPAAVPNNLAKAIISSLCCCLPLGVVAIVYAAQVDGLARSGQTEAAWDSSRRADTWANVAIALGLLSACAYAGIGMAGGGF